MRRPVAATATAVSVAAGLGWATLGPGAGTAHAGAFHWCPGDPPPQGVTTDAIGRVQRSPIYPAWDTSVCHDYVISGNHVEEGTPCILPQFQWFMCPPGTTPQPLLKPVRNQGE